jgi:O-antigen ligase
MEKMKQTLCWLITGFIFLIPLQTRLIYKQGALNSNVWEYGTFSLYATELLFLIILALTIIYSLKCVTLSRVEGRVGRKQRFALLFTTILIISLNVFLAQNQSIALYKLSQLIEAVALFFIILIIKPSFQKVSWAIVLSGLLQSIIAIEQFVNQKVIANKWLGLAAQSPEILGTPVIQLDGTRWLRTFGSFSHPNMLAGFLVIGLILIIGLYTNANKEKIKKYLSLIFVINSVALFTTLSRSAIITMFLSIIIFAFLSRKNQLLNKTLTRFALIFIFIAIIFSATYPELIFTRTFSNNRVENISNVTRVEQYKEYWPIIKNNWLTGVGLGNYTVQLFENNSTKEAWQYQPIHNTYLLIFAELGIFGLAAVLLFVFYCLFNLIKSTSWPPEKITLFTCLAGLACLALLDHYLWSFQSGIILVVAVFAILKSKLEIS